MSEENKLENLEFFESFMDSDPLEDELNPDPNANVAPDILSGEEFDPLAEEDSAETETAETPKETTEEVEATEAEPVAEEESAASEETTDEAAEKGE